MFAGACWPNQAGAVAVIGAMCIVATDADAHVCVLKLRYAAAV